MTTFWFIVITVLWTGFLVLEGFDFGVGALHGVVGGGDPGRREALHSIAPVWDGNEVWLITAGASMFAAFPGWYATAFSALYPALVLLLIALILRGAGIEFWGRRESARWRRGWSVALVVSSITAPLLVGVALADFGYGLPIDAQQEFVGNFWDLLPLYSIVTGVAFVAITLLHGAVFLSIKVHGELRRRAVRLARTIGPFAAILVIAMAIWTHVSLGQGFLLNLAELAAIVAVIAAVWLVMAGSFGWAFVTTAITIASMVVAIFSNLYPNVMVSSLNEANNLTIHNASSAPYALKVMTIIAVIFLPLVLAYQAWTYHVLRRRLTEPAVEESSTEQFAQTGGRSSVQPMRSQEQQPQQHGGERSSGQDKRRR
jgi:cytochrome bd ubiquinol oxidase subunit II